MAGQFGFARKQLTYSSSSVSLSSELLLLLLGVAGQFGFGISKMYFSHWKPPGVSERMWSVNLDASISGEYQTLGGHSCRLSE